MGIISAYNLHINDIEIGVYSDFCGSNYNGIDAFLTILNQSDKDLTVEADERINPQIRKGA